MLSVTYSLLSLALGAAHLVAGAPAANDVSRPPEAAGAEQGAALPDATFDANLRAVSNWRREAVQDLYPAPLSALAVVVGAERPVVTRCVKLNNY